MQCLSNRDLTQTNMPFSLFALLLLVAVVVVVVVFAQIGFEQTDNHKLTKIYILL